MVNIRAISSVEVNEIKVYIIPRRSMAQIWKCVSSKKSFITNECLRDHVVHCFYDVDERRHGKMFNSDILMIAYQTNYEIIYDVLTDIQNHI